MLPSEEYTEVEGRAYVNPQVSLDETTDFIQNLRDTQGQNTQQIISDTQALGTEVPSNLGGLTGAESYFTSRYQTPQTAALVADLRSTAQAKALNDALANEQAMWKKRYNDAYRAYQKSVYDKTNNPSTPDSYKPEVETNVTTPEEFYGVPGAIVSETDTHYIYTDPKTGEQTKVSKDYMKQIYDENGNITDDGMVILDIRRMLGL